MKLGDFYPMNDRPRIFIMLFLFLLISPDAHAYIDPGTGSYIVQVIIAAAIGSLVAIKQFWHMIVHFIKNIFSRKNNSNPKTG